MQRSRLTTLESMAAGALAGSATVLITNPIWVVNTRMTARKAETSEPLLPTKEGEVPAIAEKKRAPNTLSTFLKIIREDGPTRLFAGVLPALVLVINPILQYTIFEQLKQVLEKRRKVTARDSFLLGALGKLAATSITYPYITVKSRAHVATGEGREGMTASLKRIVREEGVAGLYGGMLLIFMQSCSSHANPSQALHPRSHSPFLPRLSCSLSRTSYTMPPSRHVDPLRRRCKKVLVVVTRSSSPSGEDRVSLCLPLSHLPARAGDRDVGGYGNPKPKAWLRRLTCWTRKWFERGVKAFTVAVYGRSWMS